jgi:UDP-N-acetylmuramyl pentapeptide phosphotransferase/UDP-N-acetylglucosamine-1-phosphate transferase
MAPLFWLLGWLALAATAALLTHVGIAAAIGWLRRLALARPNQRSSHVVPTPQGAGLVAVPVALALAAASLWSSAAGPPGGAGYAAVVAFATLSLMIVGFLDDMRGLGVVARLSLQALAVAAAIGLMPVELRVVPAIPLAVERVLLGGALWWFVNLFNFMDGIDLISAVETSSIALGLMLLAVLGALLPAYGSVAATLLGAMLGFAWWNRPPARVFLGDAGSLPLGFLLGVVLVHVAASGQWAAALLLPLYYLGDATITLLRRLLRHERVWEAHRMHFYQQATPDRSAVPRTIGRIALLNAVLVALAAGSVALGPVGATIAVLIGAAAVAATLATFAPP